MKFISARIASSIRDRYGVDFKLSSVDEGKEPVGFKIMIGLEKEGESSVRQTDLLYDGTEEDQELFESLLREKIPLFKDEVVDVFKYLDRIKLFSSRGKNRGDSDDFYPYPYIFKPPTPPGDLGLEGQLQAKEPAVKEPEQAPYCKYCGGILVKGESICHVCGNKVI